MAEARTPNRARTSTRAAVVLAVVVVLGLLAVLGSYLLHKERPIAGTPAPRALFKATLFTIPAHGRACTSSTALPPSGRILQLELREDPLSTHPSPPLDALLTAPGYREIAHLAGEQPEGGAELPIHPPRRYVIGSVCLVNKGNSAAVLAGSTEPRSISRSKLTINGRPTEGDIALTFLSNRRESRLSRLGQVFAHASNLSDRLIPVWLVWIIAITALLAVPIATVALFRRALQEDEIA